MERVFTNLYRIGAPHSMGMSYTYCLVREGGNLLICHGTQLSAKDMGVIAELGGLDSQWICHQHDVMPGAVHEALYHRFGCVLHHHSQDRPAVRKKTKCPVEQHGDEGLEYAPDFEVIYWPSCTSGHCIFRWQNRGRYYLFTSHAIYSRDGQWELQCNKRRIEHLRPHATRLAAKQVDYVFPGYSPVEESGFYRLSGQTRKSLAEAMAAVVA
jgi:hypothetical protein